MSISDSTRLSWNRMMLKLLIGKTVTLDNRDASWLQEIDLLRSTLPTPALEAERAQMERDCAAVCKLCATGRGKLDNLKAEWFHIIKLDGWDKPEYVPCNAAPIRSAYALSPSAAGMGREKGE